MISHLLNSFLIGILFADVLERRFPQQVRDFLTNMTFNALYLYSKMQINFAGINRKFNNFIESNPILSKFKRELYAIINVKNVVVNCSQFFKNGEECISLDGTPQLFDLAIHSWLGDDNKCINITTMNYAVDTTYMKKQSDIKFLLVELKIRENNYKVDLKTDEYNFYLVGNKFTKQFFIYYLKQHLKIKESINDDDKITVKIIDHNVDTIELIFTDKNESIILEKNGYKIVNSS